MISILYIGKIVNVGPASLEVMAETILTSVGPSGKNIEYLYNLANAMRSIDPHDEHIFQLEKAVRGLEANKPPCV